MLLIIMKYSVGELECMGTYELRELARKIGIFKPSLFKRAGLIKVIRRTDVNNALDEPFDVLCHLVGCEPPARKSAKHDVAAGFVYLIRGASCHLITESASHFSISAQLAESEGLTHGDFVTAKVADDYEKKRVVISKIIEKDQGQKFQTARGARPHKTFELAATHKLGHRIIAKTEKAFDRTEFIANAIAKLRAQNIVAASLCIEETEETQNYLATHGIENPIVTAVTYTPLKHVLAAQLAIFYAKQLAERGTDVVLFVDNLSKLAKIYNKAIGVTADNLGIEVIEVRDRLSVAALSDLKEAVMNAKQLDGSGSLTMFCFVTKPETETEKYVTSEICDIASQILELKAEQHDTAPKQARQG